MSKFHIIFSIMVVVVVGGIVVTGVFPVDTPSELVREVGVPETEKIDTQKPAVDLIPSKSDIAEFVATSTALKKEPILPLVTPPEIKKEVVVERAGTFCNGKYWPSCPVAQKFYCPPSGDAQCLLEEPVLVEIVESREITAKSVVGLFCYYKSTNREITDKYDFNYDGIFEAKGSGVVVHPDGYILTAKHIVDPKWTNFAYAGTVTKEEREINENIKFDYCEVGVSPTDHLPDAELIRKINPSTELLKPFPYIATLYFNPSQGELSDLEYSNTDFAILKITKPLEGCETFNLCNLPDRYPHNPVLYSELPEQDRDVLNYGYPAEAINSTGGVFANFLLKGAVGPYKGYYAGDKYFSNKPLSFEWRAEDVLPGRSGSPIFWRGFVVGVQYGSDSKDIRINFALGIPAIHQILKDNNLENVLATE